MPFGVRYPSVVDWQNVSLHVSIQEIIQEASKLNLRDVEIAGGEFFLYPYWADLIDELLKYEYYPYISTKYPLTEKMVQVLKDKKITSVQLSLDTINNKQLKKLLNVDENYLHKVQNGLSLLNEAGIGEKAMALWNYSQDDVREESPCKFCNEFEQCRRGKGNCWRIAIQAYGKDNYDYPAPNCPKSLPIGFAKNFKRG